MPGINTPNDRLKAGLEKFVRAVFGPRIDYMIPAFAVVVQQNGDGTVDLQFDNPKFPGGNSGGVQGIPIDTGIPGVSFKISPGARVQVVFVEGDPSKPRVTEWDSADVQSIVVTATTVNIATAAGATVNIATGAGSEINVGGPSSTVNLGLGASLVARVGDTVQAGPFAGVITASTQTVTKA